MSSPADSVALSGSEQIHSDRDLVEGDGQVAATDHHPGTPRLEILVARIAACGSLLRLCHDDARSLGTSPQ